MTDKPPPSPRVGDEIPTMVFDEEGLVGAVMARVVRVGEGEYEIEFPDGAREVITDGEAEHEGRIECPSCGEDPERKLGLIGSVPTDSEESRCGDKAAWEEPVVIATTDPVSGNVISVT